MLKASHSLCSIYSSSSSSSSSKLLSFPKTLIYPLKFNSPKSPIVLPNKSRKLFFQLCFAVQEISIEEEENTLEENHVENQKEAVIDGYANDNRMKEEEKKKEGKGSCISTVNIGDILYKTGTVHSECAIRGKQYVYVQDMDKMLGIVIKPLLFLRKISPRPPNIEEIRMSGLFFFLAGIWSGIFGG